jgi:hypothetical protein
MSSMSTKATTGSYGFSPPSRADEVSDAGTSVAPPLVFTIGSPNSIGQIQLTVKGPKAYLIDGWVRFRPADAEAAMLVEITLANVGKSGKSCLNPKWAGELDGVLGVLIERHRDAVKTAVDNEIATWKKKNAQE